MSKFGKDTVSVFNTFQAAQSLLNEEQRKKLKFREKLDLFFLDYDLMPLIIHDSYLLAMKST
jgi:replication factor C subunit 1